jgi:signal transduction histidine kinase
MASETLRAVLASMRDGAVAVDMCGKILALSPVAERLLGVGSSCPPPEEWPSAYGLFLPDTTTPLPADSFPLVRALRGEESIDLEVSVRNGTVAGLTLSLAGRPIFADDGTIVGGLLTCREVPAVARGARTVPLPPAQLAPPDARPLVLIVDDNIDVNRHVRRLMAELYRTEVAFDGQEGLEKIRALQPDLVLCDWMMPKMSGAELVRAVRVDHALDGIPIVMLTAMSDDDSRISLLRDGAQDYILKPFAAEELLARVRNLIDVGQTRRLLQAELSSTQADLRPLVHELAQRRRDAEAVAVALRIAREQAERASELKTEFLGMVSHEFRTPLTALRLQIQSLERRPEELRPKQLEAIRRLSRSSSRLEDLIESLLEYARIQAGCIKTKIENVDLTEVVHDVIEQCQPADHLQVICEAASPHLLRTDLCLVRIAISNLVDNAIKFTEQGVVEVTLTAERAGQRIGVRDTGRGIAAGDLPRIFEPFEQLSLVRNKTLAGVGLGLALVREIVSALGGTVEVTSTLGVGSAFTVALPDLPEESEVPAVDARRSASV